MTVYDNAEHGSNLTGRTTADYTRDTWKRTETWLARFYAGYRQIGLAVRQRSIQLRCATG